MWIWFVSSYPQNGYPKYYHSVFLQFGKIDMKANEQEIERKLKKFIGKSCYCKTPRGCYSELFQTIAIFKNFEELTRKRLIWMSPLFSIWASNPENNWYKNHFPSNLIGFLCPFLKLIGYYRKSNFVKNTSQYFALLQSVSFTRFLWQHGDTERKLDLGEYNNNNNTEIISKAYTITI